jgi:hypothetical protein
MLWNAGMSDIRRAIAELTHQFTQFFRSLDANRHAIKDDV